MITMRGFLLDTNVFSERQKPKPDPSVLAFFRSVDPAYVYLSVLTVGELRRGAIRKRQKHLGMSTRYSMWIDSLETLYAERLLSIDHETATVWGKLSADRSRSVVDTLLAATAIVHNLTLVTRNTKDVAGLPVRLLNPWNS